MQQIKTVLDKSGNLFIPDEYRQIAGIYPGDELLLRFESGEFRIILSKQTVRNAQELVRKYIPADRKLSDDLIQDRRKESAHE